MKRATEEDQDERETALFMDDPEWAAFIPERRPAPPRIRRLPHEDCSPIDPDAVAAHLGDGGVLGGMEGHETRPGQLDMARTVARAFNEAEVLMVEAGTGVGKSLAYLLPAVAWAAVNDTPVVVSTATRNLQSQLILADIPRALETVNGVAPGGEFRVALLKGRANYLCLRELGEAMQGGYYSLPADERGEFRYLRKWLLATKDGDLDTLERETLRSRLSCAAEDCLGRRCPWFTRCFVRAARERAAAAHLVVANHSLVLADAANPSAGILPAFSAIVFDEAHELESTATGFFSKRLSRGEFDRLLGRLERRARSGRRDERMRGLLATVVRQLDRGALGRAGTAAAIREDIRAARAAALAARGAADALFSMFGRLFRDDGSETVRYRCLLRPGADDPPAPADLERQYSRAGLFRDYPSGEWDEEALERALERFEDRLGKVVDAVSHLASDIGGATGEGEFDFFEDLEQQAESLGGEFRDFLSGARFVLSGLDRSHAYWAERFRRPNDREERIELVAAPLSVAEQMNETIYRVKDSVVLCSATLRVGDRFDYMAKRLGVSLVDPSRVKAVLAASPFDYFRQARLIAADYLPEPGEESYAAELAKSVVAAFTSSHGRGLVLFTSYEMMRAVAAAARPGLADAGIAAIVQGEGMSREAMTAALKKDPAHTVLFGAQSFWQGVDVRGEALSCVMIARLPFAQVREPIVEARAERIEETGGSAFRDYHLPEAIIKFRQGFGRLVRSKTDCGTVIVADPRMMTKNYGARFRKAVPSSCHSCVSAEELAEAVADFFDGAAS